MSDSALRLERGTAAFGRTSQAMALCLAVACTILIAARASQPAPADGFECRSDPWDFLRLGELLEPSSLVFLVEAHCANAKHVPDDWIELRYGGGKVDVELRRVDIADTTYFRIASMGGIAAP
jgi:hypothetical protein